MEVFALKMQGLYGEYTNNLNKIDIKRDQIDEKNLYVPK